MKIRIIIFFLLLPFLVVAQSNNKQQTTKSKPQKQSMEQFYATHQLAPDSASSPYLYYQVYDWAGTKYKYARRSKNGIDCSGFVSTMYKNTYCINLSGGSRDIWPTVTPIEKADLLEGDILFFKIKKGQISHVGVYLGNDKFAHASVHSGVIVSDLNDDYYKKYFFKGGRVQETIDSRQKVKREKSQKSKEKVDSSKSNTCQFERSREQRSLEYKSTK